MLIVNFPAENKNIKYKEKGESMNGKLFEYIDEKAYDYLFMELQRRQPKK
jgi:hypothetical protein